MNESFLDMSNNDDDENGDKTDPKVTPFPGPGDKRRSSQTAQRFLEIANDLRQPKEPIMILPPLIKSLCLFLFALMLLFYFMPLAFSAQLVFQLGFIPARYTGEMTFGWEAIVSPLTHLFLHGGWLHLGINIGMLMAFGAYLEKEIGMRRLALIYLLSGLAGAFTHLVFFPAGINPLIGASGAISGLFGAVLMLLNEEGMLGPHRGWRGLAPAALIWVGISLFFGFFGMPGEEAAIAWTAHVGGFIAGLIMWKPIMRSKIG